MWLHTSFISSTKNLTRLVYTVGDLYVYCFSAFSSTYIEEKLEHTFREVKQNCELVLGSREFLDASEMEKSRWQTAQLVLREIHLL